MHTYCTYTLLEFCNYNNNNNNNNNNNKQLTIKGMQFTDIFLLIYLARLLTS